MSSASYKAFTPRTITGLWFDELVKQEVQQKLPAKPNPKGNRKARRTARHRK